MCLTVLAPYRIVRGVWPLLFRVCISIPLTRSAHLAAIDFLRYVIYDLSMLSMDVSMYGLYVYVGAQFSTISMLGALCDCLTMAVSSPLTRPTLAALLPGVQSR